MVQLYDVIIYTGYLNLLLFAAILITCRCIGIWPVVKKLMGNNTFMEKIYKHHCLIWYALILSVIAHVAANLML